MENNKGLRHIALEIYQNDLKDFYQDILQAEIVEERILKEDTARVLFGINMSIKVYVVRSNSVELELFVYHDSHNQQFSHICLETEHATEIFQKAATEEYFVKKWGNPKFPTYFIKDRNGNMFELRNKMNHDEKYIGQY